MLLDIGNVMDFFLKPYFHISKLVLIVVHTSLSLLGGLNNSTYLKC
jgi:hypothetical protein